MASASPIEDVAALPGKTVSDQLGRKLGTACEIYAQDGEPMWVTVKSSTGLGTDRLIFIPLARLKEEGGEIRVPYTIQHVHDSPDVQASEELSEEDDRRLRIYYSVGIGDRELRSNNDDSYASRVPEGDGPAKKSSPEGAPEERPPD